MKTEASDLS